MQHLIIRCIGQFWEIPKKFLGKVMCLFRVKLGIRPQCSAVIIVLSWDASVSSFLRMPMHLMIKLIIGALWVPIDSNRYPISTCNGKIKKFIVLFFCQWFEIVCGPIDFHVQEAETLWSYLCDIYNFLITLRDNKCKRVYHLKKKWYKM